MPKKILFVDDDVDWHFLVNGSLRDAGYEVVVANSAGEALRHVEEDQLDLIVLDVDLGGGEEGLQLAKFLEASRPPLPIIVYSGLPAEADTIRPARSDHSRLQLQKGNVEELLKAVQTMLAGK